MLRDGDAAPRRQVFDYMDYDLKQCLDSHYQGGMPRRLIQSCMRQIFAALAFCHGRMLSA